MQIAKLCSTSSLCNRRKIGVLIRNSTTDDIHYNYNYSPDCDYCTRTTECPAIHAEIYTIATSPKGFYDELYIYAEVPCKNCLSYIHSFSSIRKIYCLNPYLYSKDYPRVLEYGYQIKERLLYAATKGFTVTQIKEL
jgi:deoxycytidylate deaminase